MNYRSRGFWGIVVLIVAIVVIVTWWADFFRVRGDSAPAGPGGGVSSAATIEAKQPNR